MAFENGNGFNMSMPVQPAYGGYGGNGFGGLDGGWWIIVLLLCGWGGFGGMGGMNMMWPMMMMNGGMMGAGGLYPWLNNSQNNNDGFRDVLLGISGVNQNICSTGNAITGAVRDGFYSAEIGANNRQMANMQQMFGLQGIMQQGFANGAAETSDLKYIVAQEGCKDRAANAEIGQKILDKLCQLELDGVKQNAETRYAALEARYNQALADNQALRFERSQTAQTAAFDRSLANSSNAFYTRLQDCPINTRPVYGNTPIWTCAQNVANQNNGCGCNGNNGYFAA